MLGYIFGKILGIERYGGKTDVCSVCYKHFSFEPENNAIFVPMIGDVHHRCYFRAIKKGLENDTGSKPS